MLSPRRSACFRYCIIHVPEERLLQCLLINFMRLQYYFSTDAKLFGSMRNPGGDWEKHSWPKRAQSN